MTRATFDVRDGGGGAALTERPRVGGGGGLRLLAKLGESSASSIRGDAALVSAVRKIALRGSDKS